jgi:diguanylate cyclase (GGDEF)-like protein
VWDWSIPGGELVLSGRWSEILKSGDASHSHGSDMRNWALRIHPDDVERHEASMQACLAAETSIYASEYRIAGEDGGWRWLSARGMVVSRGAGGEAVRMIGTISDITERKTAEERIRHMAQHDSLTGLPNRMLFSDRLQLALAAARRNDDQLALLFVDLDRFKPINDAYGHAMGDLLLKEVARRLHCCVRDSDTVARTGGDEFVVLLPSIGSAEDALRVAGKIRQALAETYEFEGCRVDISASIGIAMYPEHGGDAMSLSKSADDAMYRAKDEGRNNVQIFARIAEGHRERRSRQANWLHEPAQG